MTASAEIPARILLAEDDNDMRRFLVKALQNAGFDVISYDNGLSAYQRLREEPEKCRSLSVRTSGRAR